MDRGKKKIILFKDVLNTFLSTVMPASEFARGHVTDDGIEVMFSRDYMETMHGNAEFIN